MPKATGGRPSKYPFAGMSVGDSFFMTLVFTIKKAERFLKIDTSWYPMNFKVKKT